MRLPVTFAPHWQEALDSVSSPEAPPHAPEAVNNVVRLPPGARERIEEFAGLSNTDNVVGRSCATSLTNEPSLLSDKGEEHDRPRSEEEYDQLVETVVARAWNYALQSFSARKAALEHIDSTAAAHTRASLSWLAEGSINQLQFPSHGCGEHYRPWSYDRAPQHKTATNITPHHDDAAMWEAAVASWNAAAETRQWKQPAAFSSQSPAELGWKRRDASPTSHPVRTFAQKKISSCGSRGRQRSTSSYLSVHLAKSAGHKSTQQC